MTKEIEPNQPAKDPNAELTRSGSWKLTCQCPACNHRNQHNGGRGDKPRTGSFNCQACGYQYNVEGQNES